MRIALVSTYDMDGGAARATHRLHDALRAAGHESVMFVQHRRGTQPSVRGPSGTIAGIAARVAWRVDHLPAALVGARRGQFAVNAFGADLAARLREYAPDVVHLHWVNAGFVSLRQIARLQAAVVMTAHDMWPFTGGCHYDAGCGGYASQGCGVCPMQKRWPSAPLARQRLAAKAAGFRRAGMSVVSPSRWLADVARRSPAARERPVHVIPNCIDLQRFRPIDKAAARDLFGLPRDAIVLLFGALQSGTDARKGIAQLDAALRLLAERSSTTSVCLCMFGTATRGESTLHGLPVRSVGHLVDEESLIALYGAADLFVAPSLQDNLPNTVLEAAACGLPTIAFDIGGMPDLIEDGVSGMLVPSGDVAALSRAIERATADADWRRQAGAAARRQAEATCSYAAIAEAHVALYRALLQARADTAR